MVAAQPIPASGATPNGSPRRRSTSVNEVRGFLTGRHVGAVIVEASDPGYWTRLLTEAGLRGTTVGGVIVYPVTG